MPAGCSSPTERERAAEKTDHKKMIRKEAGAKPGTTAAGTASKVSALPVLPERIARQIDWYANKRGLPPLIAHFLDMHWRAYLLRSCLVDGHDSKTCRKAIKAIKDLAWSVQPKEHWLSRRRLIELIPQLHEQLHVGLKSVGVSAAEHDAFFAALARLHHAALHPRTSKK